MSNKKVISILITFGIILAVVGGTLAYWTWSTAEEQQTNVVFTVNKDFSCAADGGGNITNTDVTLAPTTCTDTTRAIKREVTVTPTLNRDDLTIYMDLWLDVNSIGTGLSNSQNFKYVLTTSSTSCEDGTVITSGTFNGTNTGSKVKLLSGEDYSTTTTDTYYLYVWLDSAETSSDTMNQAFNLSLNGSCTNSPKPEEPDLDDGMIPVTISEDGTVKTVDKDDASWYDYNEKEWANAIIVGNDYRSTYKGTTGVEVNEDHILGYYVWVPRFKYQVWTTITSAKGKEQEIQVIFEDADTSMSAGTAVGSYRTHPAFWWDDDNSGTVDAGEMVSGIWVGKFETTGDATTPTVKPNVASLRSQNVSTQFATAQKFSADGNAYGINYTNTNAHMMKNSEWGAAAYLSRTKYGINGEIRINNYWVSSATLTGCGAATENASKNTIECEVPYGSVEDGTYPQSSTGNISGVFDMSGGAWEYVMGNYNDTIASSGFTAMPAKKYYDKYTFDATNSCTLATCGGHALYETNAWYGDCANFVDSGTPWSARGGRYSSGALAGAFSFSRGNSASDINFSWRSVLVVGYGA